ncbi:MAG: hypothetical protein V5B60_05865 [Accumulibacter sp.]|uniref:hypothetical protein n=1 Tax=Accumulibacter sp. TaxID=2053492 RepID=UPI002FC288B9
MGQAEGEARRRIDTLLVAAGWQICDASAADIHAARAVAIREFPWNPATASPAARFRPNRFM